MASIEQKNFNFDIGCPKNVVKNGFSNMDCIMVKLMDRSTNVYERVVLFYYKDGQWLDKGDINIDSASISNNRLTVEVSSIDHSITIGAATFVGADAKETKPVLSGGNAQ